MPISTRTARQEKATAVPLKSKTSLNLLKFSWLHGFFSERTCDFIFAVALL